MDKRSDLLLPGLPAFPVGPQPQRHAHLRWAVAVEVVIHVLSLIRHRPTLAEQPDGDLLPGRVALAGLVLQKRAPQFKTHRDVLERRPDARPASGANTGRGDAGYARGAAPCGSAWRCADRRG